MPEGILSIGDGGREVGTYDTATDSPMTLVGEGALGDVMVIQASNQVRPQAPGGGGSVGDVSRSGATFDNRIARWHGTNAEIQSTGVVIDDSDNISQVAILTGDGIGLGETSPLSILTIKTGTPSSPSQGGPDKMVSVVGRMSSGDTFRAATFTAERRATSPTSNILIGVHANAEDYSVDDLTNADRAIVGCRGRAAKSGGSNTAIASMRAFSGEIEIEGGVNGVTVTDACTIVAEAVDVRGASTVINACSFRAKAHTAPSGTIENARGFWVHKQTVGTISNHGIILDGDGLGADIAFGAGQEALAYWTGSALRFAADSTEVIGLADTFQVRRNEADSSNTRMGFWSWNSAVDTEYKRGEIRAIRVNSTAASGNMEIWVNNAGTLTKAMRLKWDLKAEFPGILYAGSSLQRLTTTAGLLNHQAIDPAIAGAGLSVSSGVLSTNLTGSGTLNQIPLWTNGDTLGDSVISEFSTIISIAGTLIVNSDTDGITILGRAKIGTVGGSSDSVRIGHFDHFSLSEYGLFINSDGFIAMSAPTGQSIEFRINAVTKLIVDATDITIPANDFIVALGDAEITAGNLGIGITPTNKLHVFEASANVVAKIESNGGNAIIDLDGGGAGGEGRVQFRDDSAGTWRIRDIHADDFLRFFDDTNNIDILTLEEGGDVNIPIGDLDITQGGLNVIVGVLTVDSNQDGTHVIGRTKIGSVFSDTMGVGHFDHFAAATVGLSQSSSGATLVGAAAGQTIRLAVAGGPTAVILDSSTLAVIAADFKVNEKARITFIGGYAIKLTNKTGLNTIEGQLVSASSGTASAFDTAIANSDEVIGIVYESGVADGSEAWVVVSGFAMVRVGAGGAALNDRLVSSVTPGIAIVNNVPAVAVHFQEVGHSVEVIGGAGLVKTVLHFN